MVVIQVAPNQHNRVEIVNFILPLMALGPLLFLLDLEQKVEVVEVAHTHLVLNLALDNPAEMAVVAALEALPLLRVVLQLNQESRKDFPELMSTAGSLAVMAVALVTEKEAVAVDPAVLVRMLSMDLMDALVMEEVESIIPLPVVPSTMVPVVAAVLLVNGLALVVHGGAAAVAQVAPVQASVEELTLVTLEHSKTDNLVPPIEVVAVVQLVTAFTHIMEHLQIPVDQEL